MTRNAAISRRQFLTGAFRGREVAPSATDSRRSRDLTEGSLDEHGCSAWNEELQIPDWENNLDGVLEELEDLKGIEDF